MLAAIRHQLADRVPTDAISVENLAAIAASLGIDPEAVPDRLGLDGRIVSAPSHTMTTLQIIQRTTEPLLRSDQPHEDFTLGYCCALRDGSGWHLWYDSYDHTYATDADGYVCYAHSDDGLRWEKPALGLVEYQGSRRNNIVLDGHETGGAHGGCVFVDQSFPDRVQHKGGIGRFLIEVGEVRQAAHQP